jgi:hypothetical protein
MISRVLVAAAAVAVMLASGSGGWQRRLSQPDSRRRDRAPDSRHASRRRESHRSPSIHIVDAFPVASIGSQLLARYAVTFDLRNRRIVFMTREQTDRGQSP